MFIAWASFRKIIKTNTGSVVTMCSEYLQMAEPFMSHVAKSFFIVKSPADISLVRSTKSRLHCRLRRSRQV